MTPLDLVRSLKVADMGAHLTEDAEWWVSGDPDRLPFAGSFHGPAGFATWRRALAASVTYDRFEIVDTIAEGDRVVEVIDAAGTANATGRRYASRIVRIFTVQEGKILRVQSFFDTAAYERALA